jgi:hypothetical protein
LAINALASAGVIRFTAAFAASIICFTFVAIFAHLPSACFICNLLWIACRPTGGQTNAAAS